MSERNNEFYFFAIKYIEICKYSDDDGLDEYVDV